MKNELLFNFIPDREKNTITVRREFLAIRQMVWDCYTKSEMLDRWFSPSPMTTKTKSMDFREGGHWHYAMIEPDGNKFWGYIEYKKIVPIDYYTSIDSFCDENGDINHNLPMAEWLVAFIDKGENTIVETVVTYRSLADLEQVVAMGVEQGMASTMAKLDDLLSVLNKK